MVNALERWHRVQELCESLEAVPAARHAEVLETIEPNPGLRTETLALMQAFRLEAQGQRALSGRAAAPSTAVAPAFISHYRIVRWLGAGGSGDVFEAVRSVHGADQTVAVKRFAWRLSRREDLAQFIREQRILAAASPSSVAQFIDAGLTEDGRPFVVTEFVAGEPLIDYCDRHQLSLTDRLRLMRRVCHAVQTAHQHLIAHLDLKPSNLFVTPDRKIKVLDFGTARLVDAVKGVPGSPSLTLLYASPEQLRGAPASAACDIYSLGLILYELASGSWPFDRPDTMMSVAERAVGHSDPLPLDRTPTIEVAAARRSSVSGLARRLRGDLDAVCRKALAYEADARYATVAELEADLTCIVAGKPVSARDTSATYRFSKFVRRNAWALAALITLAGALGTAAIDATREQRLAERRATATSQFLTGLFTGTHNQTARGKITVRELLTQAESHVDPAVAGDAVVAADLEAALAAGFAAQGSHQEALDLFERAQQHAEAVNDLPRLAESRARASASLFALERPDDAWAHAAGAIAIWERASNDFSTLQSLSTIVEAAATMSRVRPSDPAPRRYYEACVALAAGNVPSVAAFRERCVLGLAALPDAPARPR